MSWLWWKSPSDQVSSSSPSSSSVVEGTQNTNSAPTYTSTSTSTNDPPTPTPSPTSTTTTTTTTTTTNPSTPSKATTPYQPLDPLTESSLPTTLPCTPLFDSAFFCSSLGGHLTSIYRTGSIADCRDNWSRFWFCMRTRAIWDADEKREVIREYNRGIWRESYYGGRNWVLRDGEYRDRTGGMDPTTTTTAGNMMASGTSTGTGTGSKYAYVTDTDGSDSDSVASASPSATAPEGSKEENSWRGLFKARSRSSNTATTATTATTSSSSSSSSSSSNGSGGDNNNLAAGGGSGRYRSSEDIWELRTEPVARAFDLHPLRDLEEVLIDEKGRKHRVKDLDRKGAGMKVENRGTIVANEV